MIHIDYKLNNVRLDVGDPRRVNAALDWEMATVGEQLSDVASLSVYLTGPGEPELLGGVRLVPSEPDFPSRDDIVGCTRNAAVATLRRSRGTSPSPISNVT